MRSNENITAVIRDYAGIAAATTHIPYLCGMVCSAVANMIANVGPFGSRTQLYAMDQATAAGFSVEYYPRNTIRVSYTPLKVPQDQDAGTNSYQLLLAKMVDCGWADDVDGMVRNERLGLEQPSWFDAISACIEVASEV